MRRFLRWLVNFLRAHWARVLTLFLLVLAPLRLLWDLRESVTQSGGLPFDRSLLEALHGRSTPFLDAVMLTASRVGGPAVMVLAGLAITVLLFALGKRGRSIFFLLAAGGAALLNLVAKGLVARQRPDLWVSLAPEKSFSFPSGHAMGSMAVVTALVLVLWRTRWRWPALVLGGAFVLLVGLSRLYLGVHYPSDVLAGWSGGLAWVVGVHALTARWLGLRSPREAVPDPRGAPSDGLASRLPPS